MKTIVKSSHRLVFTVVLLTVGSVSCKKTFLEKKNPNDIQSYWNPYKLLIDIYEARSDYAKALDILYQLDRLSPNNPEVKGKIEFLKSKQQGK